MKDFLVPRSWTILIFTAFNFRITSGQFFGGAGGGGGIGAQIISQISGSASQRGRPGAFANSNLPADFLRNQLNTQNAVAASDFSGLPPNPAFNFNTGVPATVNAIQLNPALNRAASLNAASGNPRPALLNTAIGNPALLNAASGNPALLNAAIGNAASVLAGAGNIPVNGLVFSSITQDNGNVLVGARLERRPPPVPAGSLGGLSASASAVTASPVAAEKPNQAPAPPQASTVVPPPSTTFPGYLVGSPYPFVLPPPDIPYFGSKWNGPWGYPIGHYQAFRGTGQYITHYQYYPLSYYGSLMAPFAYGVSGKK